MCSIYMRRTNYIYAIYIFGPQCSILEWFQPTVAGPGRKDRVLDPFG